MPAEAPLWLTKDNPWMIKFCMSDIAEYAGCMAQFAPNEYYAWMISEAGKKQLSLVSSP